MFEGNGSGAGRGDASKMRMCAAMAIFGSMGLVARNIALSSGVMALFRGLLGVGVLVAASLAMKKKLSKKAVLDNAFLLLVSGAALGANWICLFEAYKHTTIAKAVLTYYLAPVFVIALSPLLLKESLSAAKVVCVAASMAGLMLVSEVFVPPSAAGSTVGVKFGLAAAVLYAGTILMNKFLRGLSGIESTVVQLGAATAVLIPYVLLTEDFAGFSIDPRSAAFLVVLGVVHTGAGFLLYFSSLPGLTAQTAALFSYIDPVTAILLSALVLNERLSTAQLGGAALILGAAFLGECIGRTHNFPFFCRRSS